MPVINLTIYFDDSSQLRIFKTDFLTNSFQECHLVLILIIPRARSCFEMVIAIVILHFVNINQYYQIIFHFHFLVLLNDLKIHF